MSPLKITIMLHYYSIAAPFTLGTPQKFIDELVADGMLQPGCPIKGSKADYFPTAKGMAYVNFLKQVPMPVLTEKWIIKMEENNEP